MEAVERIQQGQTRVVKELLKLLRLPCEEWSLRVQSRTAAVISQEVTVA